MVTKCEDDRLEERQWAWSLEAQSGARSLRGDVILKEGGEEMSWKGQGVRAVGAAKALSGRKGGRSGSRAHPNSTDGRLGG